MLSPGDFKKGLQFIFQGQPYEILEVALNFRGRGRSVVGAKIKNLITGNIISRNFHQGGEFEEADIAKINLKFLYTHRGQYFFKKILESGSSSERFGLEEEQIGSGALFLKPEQTIEGLVFKDKVINVSLPIKVQLKVIEAPPGIRAWRAEAGTKQVTLETGAKTNVPLFVKEGDIIEINTQTGEYVRRIE